MLAYCGINCEGCPAYQGTIRADLELLGKASAEFGKGATTTTDWVCAGCTPADQPFLATYCAKCAIRACAIERGVANCAACDSYDSCAKIREFIGTEPGDVAQRMGLLRERFVASSGKS